jgi:hypothetical protein
MTSAVATAAKATGLESFLMLSTSHLTAAELAAINQAVAANTDRRGTLYGGVYWEDYDFGFTTVVYDKDNDGTWETMREQMSPELFRVFEYASQIGASLIRWDSDGTVIDGLPVYAH